MSPELLSLEPLELLLSLELPLSPEPPELLPSDWARGRAVAVRARRRVVVRRVGKCIFGGCVWDLDYRVVWLYGYVVVWLCVQKVSDDID